MALKALWNPNIQFLKTDGTINAGGKLKVTDHNDADSIPANYSDSNGTTLNPSPIILDALGRATCYIDDASTYDLYVMDANGAVLWTVPDMTPGAGTIVISADFSVSSNDSSVAVVISVDPNGVTNYDLSIQDEIDRAKGAEEALAEDIADETDRATAAEKAAKTKVVAGDNITVTKTVGADGQDVYTISGEDGDNPVEDVRVNGESVVANKVANIDVPVAGASSPLMDGTASVGASGKYAREDHVHPTDTSREPAFSVLPITKGGTGSGTASGARTNLDVYSKSETDSLMNGKVVIVSTLPVTGESGKIYYVGPSGSGADQYEEYLWDADNAQFLKVGERSIDLSNYKTKQTAVNDPTASGTGLEFIATASQNANGEMSVTKKTIQDGTTSQKGVVQLEDSVSSTSTTKAATPNSVKEAYDLANTALQPEDVTSTYSETGTDPVNGTAVAEAVAEVTQDTTNMSQVTAAALAELSKRLEGIEQRENYGDLLADSIRIQDFPLVGGKAMVLFGSSAPASAPSYEGQLYLDLTNKNLYFAVGQSSASDWVLAKKKQSAVALNGSTIKTVTRITQDANGTMGATFEDIRSASTTQKGVVQLSDAVDSTDTDKAATANAVKTAHDLASTKITKVSGATEGNIPVFDANGEVVDSGAKPSDFEPTSDANEVIAAALNEINARLESVEDRKNFGDLATETVSMQEFPLVGGKAMVQVGSSAPTDAPDYAGQIYVDSTNLKLYVATGESSVSDWKAQQAAFEWMTDAEALQLFNDAWSAA